MTEKTFRIGVTGSRNADEFARARVTNVLMALYKSLDKPNPVLKQGGASGVDKVAYEVATNLGCPVESFLANWSTEGKSAGPKRNRRMLDSGVDILLAFPAPDSIGTWDCIRAAVERKIPVRIYPL